MPKLTPRGAALRWLTNHRGLTEQPPNSNRDQRKDGITAAQKRIGDWLVGEAWCGVWAVNAALVGGAKIAKPYRWASVALVEDDARNKTNGFRGWTTNVKGGVLRGDLVVLFGRGVHLETVRSTAWAYRKLGLIRTEGGNTSPGKSGSQNNGGGAYARYRRLKDVRGFALVDYPGGPR